MPSRSRSALPPNSIDVAVVGFALLSFIDAVFEYFWSGNGIHGTEGALLVTVSTLLLTIATGALTRRWGPGWLRLILEILVFLDFIGTLVAAYFLEAWLLLVLVALSALFWLAHIFGVPARRTTAEMAP